MAKTILPLDILPYLPIDRGHVRVHKGIMSHGLHLLYSKTDEPWPYTIVLSGGYNGVKPTLHHLTWPEVAERLKACSLPEQAVASAHDHFDAGNDYYAGFTELNLTGEQLAAIGIRSSER